jgi:hypothetical protein
VSAPKLTAAQFVALRMTDTCHEAFASDREITPDHEALVSMGLALRARSGWARCARYMRTNAGRAALAAHEGGAS